MVIAMLSLPVAALGSGGGGAEFIPGVPGSTMASVHRGGTRHLGDRWLRRGNRGYDVRMLQAYLTVAGYGTVVDGVFGPHTKANVIAFQRSHNLRANGVVTFAVAGVLRRVVAAIESRPPKGRARINPNGSATAPAGAPPVVVAVIAAANHIIGRSYCYGGGHASFRSGCYDCSGSVSYALHGGGLLSSPYDSTEFESYGRPGPGRWITIYADSGHAFMVVARRGFNTADFGGPNIPSGSGPRWRYAPLGGLADGGHYTVRHPAGM